ncbi:MAG: ATP-binding protein [Candidatus Aenigmarchaeota archaeon]|nr:ATP-binding protein [Candidatus Aenigmarchaeota archaeon]
MDYEKYIARAKSLVQQGTEAEESSPNAAKYFFIEAAALLAEASKCAPSFEAKKESLELANQLYLRAQKTEAEESPQQFTTSSVAFKDIAGMEKVKEEIRLKLIAPLKYPDVFAKYGKSVGGGILMYGPPGCGKSLLAEATAGEAGVPFFHVKASSLKSKYVGETEKNIAKLFDEARKHEAAILFFDEFEALGADRNKTTFSYEKNFVSQLLTELDGIGSKAQRLLVIAATNLPWEIDLALRRDGRFGSVIFIPPPDATARKEMLQMMLKSCPTKDIDSDILVKLTEGFSGAEIHGLVERAKEIPLKEFINTNKLRPVLQEDLLASVKSIHPVSKKWFSDAKQKLKCATDDPLWVDMQKTIEEV